MLSRVNVFDIYIYIYVSCLLLYFSVLYFCYLHWLLKNSLFDGLAESVILLIASYILPFNPIIVYTDYCAYNLSTNGLLYSQSFGNILSTSYK